MSVEVLSTRSKGLYHSIGSRTTRVRLVIKGRGTGSITGSLGFSFETFLF